MSVRSFTVPAVLALLVAFAFAATADAGKSGRNQVVKDPVDRGGKFYDAETYARCDVREVKATVKRGKLILKVTHRGEQAFSSELVHLNVKGGKKSDPEYDLDESGGLSRFKPYKYTLEAAKVKLKNKKKARQFELPLRKLGRPDKVGFQVQTCGEGAVDIAPGKSYFDDESYDGTIAVQYKNIKTG